MSFLAINYPAWIHPEIFPHIPFLRVVRWYGLMYVFAFYTAYRVFLAEMREGLLDERGKSATEDDVAGFFTLGIALLLVGARVCSTLVYDTSGFYWRKPWLIFWPFSNGKFTGLVGMSYHGGYIGGFLGMVIWCLWKKRSLRKWIDAMGAAIPLGYTFGRLGNFFNGELFGRITTKPWGMIFPSAQRFSASLDWVKDFAARCGMQIPADAVLVNLPRHPSQLYEAFFEGVVLWAICKFLRKRKPFDGFMIFVYTFGYGFIRFFLEYCREPDIDLGFRVGEKTAATYMNASFLNLSTGQLFCVGMMAFGLAVLIISWAMSRKEKKRQSTK